MANGSSTPHARYDLMASITRFDHAVVGVTDLDAAARMWSRLGFRITPKGEHEGKGTANYCVMLPNAYVELIGITDPALAGEKLVTRFSGNPAGVGLAFGSDNPETTHAALRAAGLEAGDVQRLQRPLDLDGTREMVRFANVRINDERLAPLTQFTCHHITPELTRARHEWMLHANGATAMRAVTVSVPDFAPVRALWSAMFGNLVEADGGLSVKLCDVTLSAITPKDAVARFGHGVPSGMAHVAALTFATNECDAAAAMWDMGGVSYREEKGRLVAAPKSTCGVTIEFVDGH